MLGKHSTTEIVDNYFGGTNRVPSGNLQHEIIRRHVMNIAKNVHSRNKMTGNEKDKTSASMTRSSLATSEMASSFPSTSLLSINQTC